MSVYLLDDKVVLVDGSVSTSEDCCCGQGACCFSCDSPEHTTECDDTTELDCNDRGGVFQGVGTSCADDPAPCPPLTGACCAEDGSCTIVAEADCAGTYQGDCSVCDPNPCLTPCPCGFDAFDGSGRKFLQYDRSISGHIDASQTDDDGNDLEQTADCSATFEQIYVGCDVTTIIDTSSSSYSAINNGVEIDSCSRGDIECFCSSGSPFNQCDGLSFQWTSTNCGDASDSVSVTTTADSRITTHTFSLDATIGTDPVIHCTVSGSYTVTETLSGECTPV